MRIKFEIPHGVYPPQGGTEKEYPEWEFAYDRESHVGQLDKALAEAETNGWTVVDMKNEWKVVYP